MTVNSLKIRCSLPIITRGGDRVGIYFLEKGASQRPSKVIYDRAGSSIATATTDLILTGKKSLTAQSGSVSQDITPALNDEVLAICLRACMKRKKQAL